MCSIIDIDDLFEVMKACEPVTARGKSLGLALRLSPTRLNVIEKENRSFDECLTGALTLWLNHNYDTKTYGEPSWELLAEAVGHRLGGNNLALADEIRHRHSKHTLLA